MKKAPIIIFLLLILTACSDNGKELPAPQTVYNAIENAALLPEMVEMTADEMSDYLGVEPSDYTDFAYYTRLDSIQPDEIAIFTVADKEAAEYIREKLQARLDYKAKSAENYLPENIPIINNAIIRQDGLTVSMLVSDRVDDITAVYKELLTVK